MDWWAHYIFFPVIGLIKSKESILKISDKLKCYKVYKVDNLMVQNRSHNRVKCKNVFFIFFPKLLFGIFKFLPKAHNHY